MKTFRAKDAKVAKDARETSYRPLAYNTVRGIRTMHRRFAWAGAIAFIALGLAVAYAGWRLVRATDAEICYVCQRPMHAHSRTVALVQGHREVFCCPSCALSEHYQAGKPVQIMTLTDFVTEAKLAPEQAYMVRGSDVNPCIRPHTRVDENMHPVAVEFDRCAPGLLAFARKEDAIRFTTEHGGEVVKFTGLASAFSAPRP